jgi:hypothetical protein
VDERGQPGIAAFADAPDLEVGDLPEAHARCYPPSGDSRPRTPATRSNGVGYTSPGPLDSEPIGDRRA